MRPAALFTGITGMAVVAGLLMAGETRLRGGTAGEETVSAEETATPVDPAAQAGEPAAMSDDRAEVIARSAEPAAQPPAPPSPAPADGTAPKPADIKSSGETAAGQAASPSAKKPMELARPAVENAGMLSFGERRLQLAGIFDRRPTGYAGRRAGNGPAA
ncbi:putative membrane protein [Rhizobium leguminosarum]|nr:putative membrane protein [Rhizobium leguminosarum]